MKAYMCVVCGGVYEEEQGDAQSHIPPPDVPLVGSAQDPVLSGLRCRNADFELVEMDRPGIAG